VIQLLTLTLCLVRFARFDIVTRLLVTVAETADSDAAAKQYNVAGTALFESRIAAKKPVAKKAVSVDAMDISHMFVHTHRKRLLRRRKRRQRSLPPTATAREGKGVHLLSTTTTMMVKTTCSLMVIARNESTLIPHPAIRSTSSRQVHWLIHEFQSQI
jgi:hypothetical protein